MAEAPYKRIYRILKTAVQERKLLPGVILPGEICLAESYQVSRPTVRKALQMLAAEGKLPDGSRYLCPATVRLSMQNRTPGMAQGRGLGFALPWYENGYTGDLFPKETIGHTGFTGTSFSYDPTTGLYLIFLTNRVCPSREGTAIFRVRRLLHNAVYAAASV